MKEKIYSLDEMLTFGKHRGMTLREVVCDPEKKDPMYVQWLIAKVRGFALNKKAASFCYRNGVIDSEDVKMNTFKRKEIEPRLEKGESMKSLLAKLMFDLTHERQYIPTGFRDLDRIIGGLEKGHLYLLAGGVSIGKTSLALNLAHRLASQQKKHVVYFTLNESNRQLATRMMANLSGEQGPVLNRVSEMSEEEKNDMVSKAEMLSDLPIIFNDKSAWTLDELVIHCQMMHMTQLADVIIIDPIQNIASDGSTFNDRMTRIVQRLKRMAKDCNVPVICLSSLSRMDETDRQQPSMREMRGSGALEDCADMVMLLSGLDDPRYADRPADEAVIRLNIAKNRKGNTGVLYLRFSKSKSLFSDGCIPFDDREY